MTGQSDSTLIANMPMGFSEAQAFRLPPLILHPFSAAEDNSVLMESSRASLALQGFLPQQDFSNVDLD